MREEIQQYMKKIMLSGLIIIIVLSFCSCGGKAGFTSSDFKHIENSTSDRVPLVTEKVQSDVVKYNKEKLEEFQRTIKEYQVEYGYDELFNYEKAMEGIHVDHTVTTHKKSALDVNGNLTKEQLSAIVIKNNEEYLENVVTSIVKEVDESFILQICEIIVDVINDMLVKYPDIDRERIYCNLGNLKIVEKLSAIDYAAIEPGMVLHINRNTVALLKYGSAANMYNVIVHEAMHILQFGCECEMVEGCERRFGLAHSYSDWKQEYADWSWLGEGSAERMACLYIGTEPMTYFNHVNYILTLDFVNVLREEVPANYIESVYFYDDADKLFWALDANTEQEKQEAYKLIYSLEIMQTAPEDIIEAYYSIYGVEWTEEVSGEVFNQIKRPIIMTVTKKFFGNLADVVKAKSATKNDVMFLMNLYESTINQHIHLDDKKYDQYNAEFVVWYKEYRNKLFDAFENLSLEEYLCYVPGDGVSTINATLNWIPAEKMELLQEKYVANQCGYRVK